MDIVTHKPYILLLIFFAFSAFLPSAANAADITFTDKPSKVYGDTYIFKGLAVDENFGISEVSFYPSEDSSNSTSCTIDENSLFTCTIPSLSEGTYGYVVTASNTDTPPTTTTQQVDFEVISPVSDNPVAFWKMEDIENFTDQSGYASQATYTGYISAETGHDGNALIFNNGAINIPDTNQTYSFAGEGKSFSVEAWVYIPEGNLTGGSRRIVGKYNQGNDENSWLMGLSNDGNLYCAIWTGEPANQSDTYSSGAITTDSWHHIACTWNGVTGYQDGYVDGVNVTHSMPDIGNNYLQSSDNVVTIGARPDGSDAANISIDEVKIYNNAINYSSSTEESPGITLSNSNPSKIIGNSYTFKGTASGSIGVTDVSFYPLDDSSNPTTCIYDEIMYDFTCTASFLSPGTYNYIVSATDLSSSVSTSPISFEVVGSPSENLIGYWKMEGTSSYPEELGFAGYGSSGGDASIITGHLDNALSFTNGGRINITDINQNYSFSGEGKSFSVEAWVYVPEDSLTGSHRRIIGKYNQGNDENSWLMGLSNNGNLYCAVWTGDNPTQRDVYSEYPVPVNTWTRLTCARNGSTGYQDGYIDGINVIHSPLGVSESLSSSDNVLTIGAKPDGGDAANISIDEVKIFNKALDYTSGEQDPGDYPVVTLTSSSAVADSSQYSITGTTTDNVSITNVQYRAERNDNTFNDEDWINCIPSVNENFSETAEEFSCTLTDLSNLHNYRYQIRSEDSNNNYSDIQTFELTVDAENKLVSWLPFTEVSQIDDTAQGLTTSATLYSDPAFDVGMHNTDALLLNGTNYISFTDSDKVLNFGDIDSKFTVDFWIKPDEGDGQYHNLIQKTKSDFSSAWEIAISPSFHVYASIFSEGSGYPYSVSNDNDSRTLLTANVWNHVVFSYDFSQNEMSLRVTTDNNPNALALLGEVRLPIPVATGDIFIGASSNGESGFKGLIDDIKIYSDADAIPPKTTITPKIQNQNSARVTVQRPAYDVVVTDTTGIASVEYLFLNKNNPDFDGDTLDSHTWTPISMTDEQFGSKRIETTLSSERDLPDGVWWLYIRGVDTVGNKNVYNNDSWFDSYGVTTIAAMANYRFTVETQDTTAPYIYGRAIVPNPTVDRNPSIRGYIKDYIAQGVGDTSSAIAGMAYRLTKDAVIGDWVNVLAPLDGVWDSPFEEYNHSLGHLDIGSYTLEIKAWDTTSSGQTNVTGEDTTPNYTENFDVVEQPSGLIKTLVNDQETFDNHTYQDTVFTDAVWGNGIARLRQTINFTLGDPYFTNNSQFGFKYGDANVRMYPSVDSNGIWVSYNDNTFGYFSTTGSFVDYSWLLADKTHVIENIFEFKAKDNTRHLLVNYTGVNTMMYNLGTTPADKTDDSYFGYGNDTLGVSAKFTPIGVDQSGESTVIIGINKLDPNDGDNFLVRIDTHNNYTDQASHTYSTWSRSDGIDLINNNVHYDDFTSSYYDQDRHIILLGSYNFGIYYCFDGSAAVEGNKQCYSTSGTGDNDIYTSYSIDKDEQGIYWFAGNYGIKWFRINENITNPANDQVGMMVAASDMSLEQAAIVKTFAGVSPVGDEVFYMTRQGHLRGIEYNNTIEDKLDNTSYDYQLPNFNSRTGNGVNFLMTDKNTAWGIVQGEGLYKISLTRSFESTGAIEILVTPPDSMLAANQFTLSEVIGTLSDGDDPVKFHRLVSYQVSNDDGANWLPITEGETVYFPTSDYRLRLRINLTKGSTPIINSVKLSYFAAPDTTVLDITPPINNSGNSNNPSDNSSNNTNTTVVNLNSAPICDKQAPSQTTWIHSVVAIGANSAKLFFTPVTGTVTHFALKYGERSNEYKYGVLNVPYGEGTYVVGSLKPNTEYFFTLAPVNECAHGKQSNEISVKTGVGIFTKNMNLDQVSYDNLTSSNEAEEPSNPTSSHVVTVTIFDKRSKPIKDLKVVLANIAAITDKEGKVVFEDIEAGDHSISISKKNSTQLDIVKVIGDTKDVSINIKLKFGTDIFSSLLTWVKGLLRI